MNNDLLYKLAKEEFAIIAIEKIGPYNDSTENMIEISIQIVNWNGELLKSFESLIKPKVEFKKKFPFLEKAPLLEDIMPNIISFIEGKTPVFHNLNYLNNFINKNNICKSICTLELYNKVSEGLGIYKLNHIYAYYDIDLPEQNTAKANVIALAKLFSLLKNIYINKTSISDFSTQYIHHLKRNFKYGKHSELLIRDNIKSAQISSKQGFNKLLNRLTSNSNNSIYVLKYLNVLDKALEDRIITDKEAFSLFEIAKDLTLSRSQVINIHEEYLRKLIRIYLIDEFLSEIEIKDLNIVSDLLFINNNKLQQLIEFERTNIKVTTPQCLSQLKTLLTKSICFSGHLKCKINGEKINTELAIQLVKERGLFVKKTISKNVDYLISNDTENKKMRKAKLADQYNIIIIQEEIFWKMIGVIIDN